ncbi:MAG TPA: hypothetical protein VEV17_17815 [Bryobacteraceae bacterium]|nr:hypothetical protein [Bryobacteraceae bacterium]
MEAWVRAIAVLDCHSFRKSVRDLHLAGLELIQKGADKNYRLALYEITISTNKGEELPLDAAPQSRSGQTMEDSIGAQVTPVEDGGRSRNLTAFTCG